MSDETPWPTEATPEDQKPLPVPQIATWALPWPPSGAWCQFCWHNHDTREHQHQGDPR